MKQLFLLTCCGLFTLLLPAQEHNLEIKRDTKGVYIEHVVAAKEGFFSIGRKYNSNPRAIAAFNNLDFNKGLHIGQVLHIPLDESNFRQDTKSGIPVIHTVAAGDGLFRVSRLSGVSTETIRDLNNLGGDNINAGQKLVVGYLVTGEVKPADNALKEIAELPVSNPEPEKKEVVLQEIKEPVKEEVKTPAESFVSSPVAAVSSQKPSTMGYFKSYFDQQVKQKPVSTGLTANSGVFKTISGWQDGKYYLLLDNVQPGTIVKVSNPQNGKVIFAKVLGKMEGVNFNKGLDVRISNAAASVLDIPETENEKFVVLLNY